MDKLGVMLATLFARNIFQKMTFRGAAEVLDAMFDPGRYGEKFIERMGATTAVPAILAQPAQALDPFEREVRGFMDALIARIPVARQSLPIRYNALGEPITRSSIGPSQTMSAEFDPVKREINRLGMGVGKPRDEMDHVKLTPQQYEDYVRIGGGMARELIEAQMRAPYWERLPDEQKKVIIHNQITAGHTMAKVKVQMESMGTPDDIVQKAMKERLLRFGIN